MTDRIGGRTDRRPGDAVCLLARFCVATLFYRAGEQASGEMGRHVIGHQASTTVVVWRREDRGDAVDGRQGRERLNSGSGR